MSKIVLKPCPFCGSTDVDMNLGEVRCNDCEVFFSAHDRFDTGDLVVFGDRAVAAQWNRRATTQEGDDDG